MPRHAKLEELEKRREKNAARAEKVERAVRDHQLKEAEKERKREERVAHLLTIATTHRVTNLPHHPQALNYARARYLNHGNKQKPKEVSEGALEVLNQGVEALPVPGQTPDQRLPSVADLTLPAFVHVTRHLPFCHFHDLLPTDLNTLQENCKDLPSSVWVPAFTALDEKDPSLSKEFLDEVFSFLRHPSAETPRHQPKSSTVRSPFDGALLGSGDASGQGAGEEWRARKRRRTEGRADHPPLPPTPGIQLIPTKSAAHEGTGNAAHTAFTSSISDRHCPSCTCNLLQPISQIPCGFASSPPPKYLAPNGGPSTSTALSAPPRLATAADAVPPTVNWDGRSVSDHPYSPAPSTTFAAARPGPTVNGVSGQGANETRTFQATEAKADYPPKSGIQPIPTNSAAQEAPQVPWRRVLPVSSNSASNADAASPGHNSYANMAPQPGCAAATPLPPMANSPTNSQTPGEAGQNSSALPPPTAGTQPHSLSVPSSLIPPQSAAHPEVPRARQTHDLSTSESSNQCSAEVGGPALFYSVPGEAVQQRLIERNLFSFRLVIPSNTAHASFVTFTSISSDWTELLKNPATKPLDSPGIRYRRWIRSDNGIYTELRDYGEPDGKAEEQLRKNGYVFIAEIDTTEM